MCVATNIAFQFLSSYTQADQNLQCDGGSGECRDSRGVGDAGVIRRSASFAKVARHTGMISSPRKHAYGCAESMAPQCRLPLVVSPPPLRFASGWGTRAFAKGIGLCFPRGALMLLGQHAARRTI